MISLKIMSFIFISLLLKESTQSHWRGGAIYWAPSNPSVQFPISNTDVLITQRYASELNYDAQPCSSPTDIGSSKITTGNAALESENGPNWKVSTFTICKDYSIENNWQGGERTALQNVITTETIHARFVDGCWSNDIFLTPSTNLNSCDWFYDIYIDLKQRSDTGKINSSPQTTADFPIFLSTDCSGLQQAYVIPVSDPDGDIVKCRCYNNDCFSGLIMNENACSFTFNPTNVGVYGIYITIEDFAPNNQSVALTSVPLVIAAYVVNDPSKCCKFKLLN